MNVRPAQTITAQELQSYRRAKVLFTLRHEMADKLCA